MLVVKIFYLAFLATALQNARAGVAVDEPECEPDLFSDNCELPNTEIIATDEKACKNYTEYCCWSDEKGCYNILTPPPTNKEAKVDDEICETVPLSVNCVLPTKESIEDNKEACQNHTNHCCWIEGSGCFSRLRPAEANVSLGGFEVPKRFKRPERRLGVGGLPFLCPEDEEFPASCKLTGFEPYVTEPPVDIPYCVRIPCSLDRRIQAELEKSQLLCGSQPGCYYDVPLGEFRAAFGPTVLAGVPACQLAIRNEAFLTEAREAARVLPGGWNPYFTNCTLKTFEKEIEQEQPGCLLIPLLKAFGIYPKMATWKGQTSNGCMYINGCWIKTEGCFYPVKLDNVFIKSGQRFAHNPFEIVHGRPKCQHFDMTNPYTILNSFHICLASGCSIDVNIASTYYENLFAIGKQMDVPSHWEFWNLVEKEQIGSFNIDKGIYWPYDKTFSGHIPTQPPAPTQVFVPPGGNVFSSNFGGGGGGAGAGGRPSGPFALPFKTTKPPTPLTTGVSHGCGPLFKDTPNVRPCPPPPPPPPKSIQLNKFCPYKPIKIPRYKELKGSFAGCCEINLCYLSRSDIRKLHSGPSHYYTEWSYWQRCTKSCGGGTRTRTRKCISQKPEEECTLSTEIVEACALHPCPTWSPWGHWTPCPGPCKIQTRRRSCIPIDGKCVGDNEETRWCYCPGK